jgi:hypothetical protein
LRPALIAQQSQKCYNIRMKELVTKIATLAWVLFFAGVVTAIKLITIQYEFEPVQFSAILGSMISANIFLMGFMLTGVLADYKEAERIPDEVAVSVEAIFDQCYTTYKRTQNKDCLEFIQTLFAFIKLLKKWFTKKIRTREVMYMLNSFNEQVLKIEALTQPTFIARIKKENSNLRRLLLRAYSIREKQFLGASHTIILLSMAFVLVSLVLTKYADTFEAMLYVFGFSAIFIFIVKLIYDLDNPFDYYSIMSRYKDEVSLQSLDDLHKRITGELKFLK